jgi:hypothetical protein
LVHADLHRRAREFQPGGRQRLYQVRGHDRRDRAVLVGREHREIDEQRAAALETIVGDTVS